MDSCQEVGAGGPEDRKDRRLPELSRSTGPLRPDSAPFILQRGSWRWERARGLSKVAQRQGGR